MPRFRTFFLIAPLAGMLGAAPGTLKLNVNPSRAGVFVDGKYVGPAGRFMSARIYSIEAGEHEIKLSDPRYEDIVQKLTITAGQRTELSQTMKRKPEPQGPFGMLRIMHPDELAAVYLNTHFMGHVDEFSNFAQGIKLQAGIYELRIEPTNGSQPVVKSITIEANKTLVVQ